MKRGTTPAITVKNHPFISGTYTGFFNYRAGGERYPMALSLTFSGGKIAGQGKDQYGPFIVLGTFDSGAGECRWVKTYSPDHTVEYRGFSDERGLWGTWELAGIRSGGFQLLRSLHSVVRHKALTGGTRRSLGR